LILTVTLNPAVDHFVLSDHFTPAKLNRVKDLERHPGGKGINIAVMLAKMGVDVISTGFLNRSSSLFVQQYLRDNGVTTSFTHIADETRHNYFIIDEATGNLTVIDEEGPTVSKGEFNLFLQNYKSLLKRVNMVVIAGSNPRGVEDQDWCQLFEIANHLGVKTAVNVQEDKLMICLDKNPYLVLLDTRSSSEVLGKKIEKEVDQKQAACRIMGEKTLFSILTLDYQNYMVSTTEGCNEVNLSDMKNRNQMFSGDAMMAGLVYSLNRNDDVKEAVRWGGAVAIANSSNRIKFINSMDEVKPCLDKVSIREVQS
jgi:1-phosphofructokinase family hexose kinase